MTKERIRQFVLDHALTRELFFLFGKRKADLAKIDRALAKGKLELAREKAENTIVSLTSYGERIPELKYTLHSLVTQSVRPERIVVNIAFGDEKRLTDEVKAFGRYGVEFFFCEDIRSYKKLLPALRRFPSSSIVTADDDIYYEKDWLKRFCETHREHPGDVLGHLVYKITHGNGKIAPYAAWVHNYRAAPGEKGIFIVGAKGALYPPGVFHPDIRREDLFMRLSPLGDDLWFHFMTVLNGGTIRQVESPLPDSCYVNPYREYGISAGSTLTQQNVGNNRNDTQLRNILRHYGIPEEAFVDCLEGKNDLAVFRRTHAGRQKDMP